MSNYDLIVTRNELVVRSYKLIVSATNNYNLPIFVNCAFLSSFV